MPRPARTGTGHRRAAPPALLGTSLLLAAAQTCGAAAPVAGAPQAIVVGLVLNGKLLADGQLVHREPGSGVRPVWLPAKQAEAWRMDLAQRPRRPIEGIDHAAFCIGRDRCHYDEATANLTLALASSDLLPLHIRAGQAESIAPTPNGVGGVMNYDVSAWHVGKPGAAALVEGRVYTPQGHGAVRVGIVHSGGRSVRTVNQAVWQVDRPAQGVSWQAGSIAIPDTAIGTGMPLTGVRVGSNARLRPGRSKALLPEVADRADRALRADVFVDGMYRQTASVPYGPYRIEIAPPAPGRGEVELVATDVDGRQTRRSVPYYLAPEMLAPGETDWSADLGVLAADGRPVRGRKPAVASAALRRGLDERNTAQAQLLVARRAARLSLGLDHVEPRLGMSSLSLVAQRSDAQRRQRVWLGAGHEFLSRTGSLAIRAEQVVGGCTPAAGGHALADRLARPCGRVSGLASWGLGRWSVQAAAEAQQGADGRRSGVAGLNLRLAVGLRSQLGLSLQRLQVDGKSLSAVQLSWMQPLDDLHVLQVGAQARAGQGAALQWGVQSAPGSDTVDSQRWQAYGSLGEFKDIGARWSRRGHAADIRAEGWVDGRGAHGSVGVSGAFGLAEGRLFGSRRIDDSFVVVDVGLPDLPVLLDNREVARTNAAGWAVVTEARAHQANMVGVDTSSLPIRYAMPRDQQNVTPSSRAGVVARFDVSDGGVSLPVVDEQGVALPAGAQVEVSTQQLQTAVTSRSEVFLERSDRPAQVKISWRGQSCRFQYQPERTSDRASERQKGPLVCRAA